MKSQEKPLSGQEKLELAETTLLEALHSLNFNIDLLGRFIWSLHDKEQKIYKLLCKIEHGVDKNTMNRNNDHKQQDYNRILLRSKMSLNRAFWQRVGTFFICRNKLESTSRPIIESTILGPGNKSIRDIIQLCLIQMIAHDRQISQSDFEDYRYFLKYMRRELELNRMELALANQPNYPVAIKQVDLFIKIFEERVNIWDKNSRKKTKRKPA